MVQNGEMKENDEDDEVELTDEQKAKQANREMLRRFKNEENEEDEIYNRLLLLKNLVVTSIFVLRANQIMFLWTLFACFAMLSLKNCTVLNRETDKKNSALAAGPVEPFERDS